MNSVDDNKYTPGARQIVNGYGEVRWQPFYEVGGWPRYLWKVYGQKNKWTTDLDWCEPKGYKSKDFAIRRARWKIASLVGIDHENEHEINSRFHVLKP